MAGGCEAGSEERLEWLDNYLWTYREDSFLPHGTERDGAAEAQPVFLTATPVNPNAANVRFLVEGAEFVDADGYERVMYLFDGADQAALGQARSAWKQAKASVHQPTYWRQSEFGRWEKQQLG